MQCLSSSHQYRCPYLCSRLCTQQGLSALCSPGLDVGQVGARIAQLQAGPTGLVVLIDAWPESQLALLGLQALSPQQLLQHQAD